MPKFNPTTDLMDLKGKVVVVTGGNRGIGLETVRQLAQRGAKVYLGARSETVASAVIQKLQRERPESANGEVVWLPLDLSDPRLAKEAASDFLAKETRLDILINNAGTMDHTYAKTADGVSHAVVVNYISPFVFTQTLLPLLKETATRPESDVRIINVASTVHRMVSPRFRNKEDFNVTYNWRPMAGFLRYCHSKFPIIPWTKELQRRFDAENTLITCIALHPGGVDTFSQNWPLPRISTWLVRLAISPPEEGAFTTLFAAASPQVASDKEQYKGQYLEPIGKLSKPSKLAEDPKLADELWTTTQDFLTGLGL
ncbi:hypothetical protein HGRIS_000536 [Hohenbuehelia grisea]|uniref:NAD(P)-binding protein n=1 Tax=Hohenbuehelia grisea TaxID=104357 RepID=A0ABR3JSP2_9AGAR